MRNPVALARRTGLASSALLIVSMMVCEAPALSQNEKLTAVESTIAARIKASGADVALYFSTLDGKTEWSIEPDEVFHAASTMKLAVMIELFREVKEGKVRLTDTLAVKNEFRSIVDGSLYRLSAEDDSDRGLYQAEGQARSLGELCELMITVSSNLATNLLIEKLGVENIRAAVHALGADGVVVLRGVEDGKAFEQGKNNTTTARGLGTLLAAIARGESVDAAASRQMIEILERQKFNEGIPAGLPAGIAVAHKTGEITKIHHDAAIVFAKRPYVLVILVRGLLDGSQSAALMRDVSRDLYQATQ